MGKKCIGDFSVSRVVTLVQWDEQEKFVISIFQKLLLLYLSAIQVFYKPFHLKLFLKIFKRFRFDR